MVLCPGFADARLAGDDLIFIGLMRKFTKNCQKVLQIDAMMRIPCEKGAEAG